MVVQHFSPVGFSRNQWPAQAEKIMENLNLSSKKLSELEYTNPPIELGEVYLGYKSRRKEWKLIYILPKPIWEGDDEIWATFVRIFPPKTLPKYNQPSGTSEWYVAGAPTKMSIKDGDSDFGNYDHNINNRMSRRIAKSYPDYISLTQLKELLKPIQFMNWMWGKPLSPKEEPKITKEEPKEPPWVPWENWYDDSNINK